MPTICRFYGIVIRMYFDDHAPPHFHAVYGEFHATIDIAQTRVLQGGLPKRALELVVEWGELHRDELAANWRLCQEKSAPLEIEPLP